MNDTSTRYHHGCTRVMRLLVEGLESNGLSITARSPAGYPWAQDLRFLRALERADVVVINGEGTLHHGRPAGRVLLSVVDHPACRAKVALVNALWQENPEEWGGPLSRIALRAARDSASAFAMQAAGGTARWLPDLSLSSGAEVRSSSRDGVIVGDSVRLASRKILARAALALPRARYVPTKTLSGRIWDHSIPRRLLFSAYNGIASLTAPAFHMPRKEIDYLAELSSAEGLITGRFHAVCLAMLTETPFLALGSNASKIERLLIDAGLGLSRMVSASDLVQPSPPPPFTAAELDAISAFRTIAKERAQTLFSDIESLARESR
jgi:polysaccharide pyruvyl transferase WcaK-like protein